jgi:hypothetical protein
MSVRAGESPQGSPEPIQEWLKRLMEKRLVKDRATLPERSGKLVADSLRAITDGPFAEAKDVIGRSVDVLCLDFEQSNRSSK